jgi:trans-AT polyketide synthase/acyltransferase/oxidoreductase domain-containing protein
MDTKRILITAASLGNASFRRAYGLKYAYLAGAMYRGIASKEIVIKMARAGLLAYLGTAGMPLAEVEGNLKAIRAQLTGGEPFGLNVLSNLEDPEAEMNAIALYMRYGVGFVEAAAYMQVSPALVWYRVAGLSEDADGKVVCNHRILAKISRPEVAAVFMSPPPDAIVRQLQQEGRITAAQAALAARVPMAGEICVEADSGGHTDMGIPTVIFPPIVGMRDEFVAQYGYKTPIYVGQAGGIGSPQAAAAAFTMGADFILTGSINQCTVEAGTSDVVKDILQEINTQDTEYAPAGDMFEIGAKVQVLKRGVFFPARANRLHALYTQYASLDEIPESVRRQIQDRYFQRSFDDVWQDIRDYLQSTGRAGEAAQMEGSPKQKMARIFKWYFAYTTRLALTGEESRRVDFQVHTGPALGSFNQWVKDSPLKSWRNRHVDDIAERLMTATAQLISDVCVRWFAAEELS